MTVSFAIDRGVRATRNNRVEAACVTASFVCADSIVAIRTWNGSSCLILGDLFDGWLFEPVDREGQAPHDRADAPARDDRLRTAVSYRRERRLTAENRDHIPDGQVGHRGSCFTSGAPEMRDQDDILERQQVQDGLTALFRKRRAPRLRCRCSFSAQTSASSSMIAAARRIDEERGSFHTRERPPVEHVTGLGGGRSMDGDDIGADEQFVERHVVLRKNRGHAKCRAPWRRPRDLSARGR